MPPPEPGCRHLEDQEASGWIVHLPGVRFPIVCATLTGRIAYHPADNVFDRYACIMRFIHRYYDGQAQLRRNNQCRDAELAHRWQPCRLLAQARR
jgi:hypothetical protein